MVKDRAAWPPSCEYSDCTNVGLPHLTNVEYAGGIVKPVRPCTEHELRLGKPRRKAVA